MATESTIRMRSRGVLAFSIGDVGLGAHLEEVEGLAPADRLAPLPRQRHPFAGVVSFRGFMVPVLDLAAYLGLPARPPTPSSARYAVVLARGTERFGVLVPEIPRLIPAQELGEVAVGAADPDLRAVLRAIYERSGSRIHCLNYWSIIDSVTNAAGRPTRTAYD